MFNAILVFTQEKLKYLYENSVILRNLDTLILLSILAVFVISTFATSDSIGFVALVTMFLSAVKMITKSGERTECNKFELFLLIYFMFVLISVAGSSLFALSLKGFLKTCIYLGFYVSLVQYLKTNLSKIPLLIATIACCLSFEAIIGILQNYVQVQQISTWQDVSHINPEHIMTRVYGTLKPYNPNLMGGYFIVGLPCLYGLTVLFAVNKNKNMTILGIILSVISTMTAVFTGSRGAYVSLAMIFVLMFLLLAKFVWNTHRKIYLGVLSSAIIGIIGLLIFCGALRTRIFSIFAMHADSSNAFRFQVYEAAVKMFQDNWLLGIGVGNQNFREIYGLYMRTGYDALSAYNVFLEIGIESGIFALMAFAGFIILLVTCAVKYINNTDNVKNIIIVALALISVLAVMVHGLTDTIFFRPQVQFIFWTMVAFISAICNPKLGNE